MKALVIVLWLAFLGSARAEPLWVGISAEGPAASSRDGQHWAHETRLKGKSRAIAFGDGRFVAVGERIATTNDGVTWRDLGPAPARFDAITFGQRKFIAVFGAQLWESADGEHFAATEAAKPLRLYCRGLACGDTEAGFCFVGIGTLIESDSEDAWCAVSSSGKTWDVGFFTRPAATAIAYGAGHFLVAGWRGFIQTAHDAVTWVTQTPPSHEYYNHALWTGDRFLIKGEHVWSSPDGEKWTPAEPGFDPWGDRFTAIAIGDVP